MKITHHLPSHLPYSPSAVNILINRLIQNSMGKTAQIQIKLSLVIGSTNLHCTKFISKKFLPPILLFRLSIETLTFFLAHEDLIRACHTWKFLSTVVIQGIIVCLCIAIHLNLPHLLGFLKAENPAFITQCVLGSQNLWGGILITNFKCYILWDSVTNVPWLSFIYW